MLQAYNMSKRTNAKTEMQKWNKNAKSYRRLFGTWESKDRSPEDW